MESPSIAVILNAYKRDYFDLQVSALQNQSVPPTRILLWQNEKHVDVSRLRERGVEIIQSDHNFTFFGRFALACLADTEYIAVIDDDTIPGRRGMENALRCHKKYNCLVGQNARNPVFDKNNRVVSFTGYGDDGGLEDDRLSHTVGHFWFFPQKWAHKLFELPITFDNCEDATFSAILRYKYGIETYCAKSPANERDVWLNVRFDLGCDQNASFRRKTHNQSRVDIVNQLHDYFGVKNWP